MRITFHAILFVIMVCGTVASQTVPPVFKFPDNNKPGDSLKITGTGLDAVKSITLRPEGKPEVSVTPENVKVSATEITFSVPASASGKVALLPGSVKPIPLTVTPAQSTATVPPTEEPVIDSVFPTTTYPVEKRFSFDINGQHFSPDPAEDQIEVEGQGMISFVSRHRSLSPDAAREAAQPVECKQEPPEKYPCLEVSQDGHKLLISGFPRRYAYQGPLRVRVWVKNVPSKFSNSFTLSRVDHRIIVWLAFAFFGLLMYVVYRLVSRGIQGYAIAGRKYSPLAAFLIDKSTDTYSLSKFQLFAFSMVAFFGYVYVFLCRALVQWNFTFPEIPDNYPSLLAISAGTTAAAVGLNSTRGTKGAGPVYPSAGDFISNGGLVVAERFQFFVWTLIACIGFITLILMQDPAKVDAFPTFPSGLLYVMGVSAAGYLGGKAVRSPGPILKEVQVAVPAGASTDLNVTLNGENLDKNAKFRIDGALQAPVGTVNGIDQPQGPRGYCTKLDFMLSQAAGFAQGDHTFDIVNGDGVGAQAMFTATPMKIIGATAITHGTTGPVTLTVLNYREKSSARWLPQGTSVPLEIATAEVNRTGLAPLPAPTGAATVVVTVPAGNISGTGTLTLVSPLGGTEATSVTVN